MNLVSRIFALANSNLRREGRNQAATTLILNPRRASERIPKRFVLADISMSFQEPLVVFFFRLAVGNSTQNSWGMKIRKGKTVVHRCSVHMPTQTRSMESSVVHKILLNQRRERDSLRNAQLSGTRLNNSIKRVVTTKRKALISLAKLCLCGNWVIGNWKTFILQGKHPEICLRTS